MPLQILKAGSWVNGTLATWMGEAAKNRGWDLLCDAKQAVDEVLAQAAPDTAAQGAITAAIGAVREFGLVLVVWQL
ncbi:MAG: hypothetical protein WDM77_12545 [Steroidobacteraceae bacterium]